jgi:hypothetical protein
MNDRYSTHPLYLELKTRQAAVQAEEDPIARLPLIELESVAEEAWINFLRGPIDTPPPPQPA